jgi:hypothetical protein
MFWHNYLSMNGIVSFPSFTWLYKYTEEYKQGEMWHSAQGAKICEEICMFQPCYCQAMGTWLISTETNNEELLIARQRFRNHGHIDSNNWSRRLYKECYGQLQESSRYTRAVPGNQLVVLYSFTNCKGRGLALQSQGVIAPIFRNHGEGWLLPCPSHFITKERAPSTYWMGAG